MLCPFCQTYAQPDAIVCPNCGKMLPAGENKDIGLQAMRQGRRARLAAAEKQQEQAAEKPAASLNRQGQGRTYEDPEKSLRGDTGEIPVYASAEVFGEEGAPIGLVGREPSRTVYGDTTLHGERIQPQRPMRRKDQHAVTKHMVNWTHVAIAGAVVLILLLIGGYLALTRTSGGQRLLARMGRSVEDAEALWIVAEEKLDEGYIDEAINMFLEAREKDGEDNVNVPGLLLLGSAYEAGGRLEEALALYQEIYTDIAPSAPDAYTCAIRILETLGRGAEAAEVMQLAYDKTNNVNFRAQRRELLPTAPEVNVTAGTYDYARTLLIHSNDGFDVYYTFDEEAVLPDDGTLFTEGIYIDEGNWKLRAVAVNGDLVSDELVAVYRIVMPSPGTPNCNLAPNTYKKRQSVRLRKNPDNEKDEDIIIYYTIDGSLPSEDSPVYDGTPIAMPSGNVTLQAVAVNKYGKASNTFSRTFRFEQKPFPKSAYSTEDTVNNVVLYQTTLEQFEGRYGKAQSVEEVEVAAYHDTGSRYNYHWGYATFYREKGTHRLVELYFTDTLKGPRSTGIGSMENDVVGQFRDMGQVTSPSGNRGLYSLTNSAGNVHATGKIFAMEDGTRMVRYTCTTADSHTWYLDYLESSGGVVKAIRMTYYP